jgi:hypothetical protein
MRILIVEDHLDTAELMGRLLRRRGHEVFIATSAAEAATAVSDGQAPFHLALSDVILPDGNGIELITKLKAAGVSHAIAISGTEDDAARATAAGFEAHLLKPVQFDQLVSLIAGLE